MEKIIINSHDEFAAYLGKELGYSPYIKIGQKMIDLFADATLDDQWIHIDQERAVKESPFKSTIAHGYLTLSLVPHLWYEMAQVNNVKMMVNYGIENFKFGIPVVEGSEVRLLAKLENIVNLRGVSKVSMRIKMEIKDERKAAFEGIFVFLYYFE